MEPVRAFPGGGGELILLYDPAGNNLREVPKTSPGVKNIVRRKARAGADYWRTHSIVDTGYNASHVELRESDSDDGNYQAIIYCTGYYAKWREIGSSRAGPRAPEWVLKRSVPTIEQA
jgi:hypothetical protein